MDTMTLSLLLPAVVLLGTLTGKIHSIEFRDHFKLNYNHSLYLFTEEILCITFLRET